MLSKSQNSLCWREWAAAKRTLTPGRVTWTKHGEAIYESLGLKWHAPNEREALR
jgi:hypothetical protein